MSMIFVDKSSGTVMHVDESGRLDRSSLQIGDQVHIVSDVQFGRSLTFVGTVDQIVLSIRAMAGEPLVHQWIVRVATV